MHQFPNRIISQKAQNPPPGTVVPCCTYLALSLSLCFRYGIAFGWRLYGYGPVWLTFCSWAASLMIFATSKVHFWSSDKESLPTSLKQHGQSVPEHIRTVRTCFDAKSAFVLGRVNYKAKKKRRRRPTSIVCWQETGQSLASRLPFARSLSSFAGACLCRWTARIWYWN